MANASAPQRKIFVSATSSDLTSYREVAKKTLFARDIMPKEQAGFAPTHQNLDSVLEQAIAECDAVVCIVGFQYGAEPENETGESGGRSFTQMEYDTAKRLKKPLFIFMTDESTPVDPGAQQSEEFAQRQLQHRKDIEQSGIRWQKITSREHLAEQIALARFPQRRGKLWVPLIAAAIVVALFYGGWKWRVQNEDKKFLMDPRAAEVFDELTSNKPPKPTDYKNPLLCFDVATYPNPSAVAESVPEGGIVRSGTFSIFIEPLTDGYLYVFQIDSKGKVNWLYPKNSTCDFSEGLNPVSAKSGVIRLPQDSGFDLALDETVGKENIICAVSATPWPELESKLQEYATLLANEEMDLPDLEHMAVAPEPYSFASRGSIGVKKREEILISLNPSHSGYDFDMSSEVFESDEHFLVVKRWFHHR